MTPPEEKGNQKSRRDAGGTEWQMRRYLLFGLFEALPFA
jgi:hypothetical protein